MARSCRARKLGECNGNGQGQHQCKRHGNDRLQDCREYKVFAGSSASTLVFVFSLFSSHNCERGALLTVVTPSCAGDGAVFVCAFVTAATADAVLLAIDVSVGARGIASATSLCTPKLALE